MSSRAGRDAAVGSAFSIAVHLAFLIAAAGWLRVQSESLSTPLAVALWTEPFPSAEAPVDRAVSEPAEEARGEGVLLPEAEPAPERTERPERAVDIPAPSPEPERPELPVPSAVDEAGSPLPMPRHEDLIEAPPSAGPASEERRRLLAEQSRASDSSGVGLAKRLQGSRERVPVKGPEPTEVPSAETGDAVLAVERGVSGPLGQRRILYSEKPPYPEWARRLGLEAEIRFRFWVAPDGRVNRIEFVTFSGSTELDRLAERTLRKWRFEPLPRGVPQRDEWGVVPMIFTLIPGGGGSAR